MQTAFTRALRATVAAAAILLIGAGADAAKPRPALLTTEPPPGFEIIDRERELLVDIVFAEERLGRTIVSVKSGMLRFKEPAKVAAQIEGLREAAKIAAALAEPLAVNVGRLCAGRQLDDSKPADCGTLAPAIAGIILDEARLRVLVFVNERFLAPRALSKRKFLPRPDGGPSFVARLDGSVAGSNPGISEMSFRTLALAAWGAARLRSENSFASRDGWALENLTVEWDRPGWQYRAGYFRGFGTPLSGETRAYGVGFTSSTATRIDLDQAFGSQVSVFLSKPAFIEVLRDGRIVSSRYYPAGSRLIDTAALPDGAYPITIRIREIGGGTREETRFFSKSDLIPPSDQPLYFADVGVIAQRRTQGIAAPTSVPIARGGVRYRVANGLALGAEFVGTPRDGLGEAGVFYMASFARLSASAFATPHGDWGTGLAVTAQYRTFSVNASARFVRAARARIEYPDDPKSFRFVNGSALQANIGAAHYIGNTRIGFNAQVQKSYRPDIRTTYAFGPNFYVPLVDTTRHTVQLIGEFAKTEQGYTAFAKLTWRWQAGAQTVVTADAGLRALRGDSNREFREAGRVELTHQPAPFMEHDITLQPSIVRDGPLFLGLNGDAMGPLGRANGAVRYGIDGPRRLSAYGANISTGVAIDARGIALGGRDPHASGIIVKVVGGRDTGRYQVLVDGTPRLTLRGGEAKPIFLSPYGAYVVSLRPADGNETLSSLSNLQRRVVLYPGNAQTIEWNVEPVSVVFGRALAADGTPVANARVEGVVGIGETDDRGYFQVEVNGNRTLTLKRDGQPDCILRLAGIKAEKDYARAGTLRCDGSVTADATPPPRR